MIKPKLLAQKIEALQNSGDWFAQVQRHPRLSELLWFLQAASMRPGGLSALVKTLLADYPEAFVTTSMRTAGTPANGEHPLAVCVGIWRDWKNGTRLVSPWGDDLREDEPPTENFDLWRGQFNRAIKASPHERTDRQKAELARGLRVFNWTFLTAHCVNGTERHLADYLRDLCEDQQMRLGSPWYCADLPALLIKYMDDFAAQQFATIAETAVSKIVFRNLEFAISQNVPVPIVGESRIGKSSPATVWCHARPGRARLVTVPESNRFRDFIETHATALGIQFLPSVHVPALAAEVKYVLRFSGLFLTYDEAHFTVPIHYTKTTPPARIDFIRCQVIDKGMGCAFIATPQSYRQTLDQYVKTTGHRIEQWLGRLAPAVILPADLGREDLAAVAKIHFTQMPAPLLKLIVASAMKSEGYLKTVDITARKALFIAQENRRTIPTVQDVLAAIEEMNPSQPQPAIHDLAADEPQPRRVTAAPLPARRSNPISVPTVQTARASKVGAEELVTD